MQSPVTANVTAVTVTAVTLSVERMKFYNREREIAALQAVQDLGLCLEIGNGLN